LTLLYLIKFAYLTSIISVGSSDTRPQPGFRNMHSVKHLRAVMLNEAVETYL
jgi:hypothetical protein